MDNIGGESLEQSNATSRDGNPAREPEEGVSLQLFVYDECRLIQQLNEFLSLSNVKVPPLSVPVKKTRFHFLRSLGVCS